MIRVHGDEKSREYRAASDLQRLIGQYWPSTVEGPDADISLVCSLKTNRADIRDIDVVLLLRLVTPLPCKESAYVPPGANGPVPVYFETLAAVIEVKGVPPEQVKVEAEHVKVTYSRNRNANGQVAGPWDDVSETNWKQIHAFNGLVERRGGERPYTTGLIWLSNVDTDEFDSRPDNLLGSRSTWEDFLSAIVRINANRIRQQGDRWVYTAMPDAATFARMAALFTQVVTATRLDRRRMEIITQQTAEARQLETAVGSRLLVLKGLGGTGKTTHLLQIARRLSEDEEKRVLLLTYNRALVADISRLLSLLQISRDLVQVRSVHSFLRKVMLGLGVTSGEIKTFLEDYDRLKSDTLEYLASGALSSDDVVQLKENDPNTFQWDCILIDEAQDWPSDERNVLFHLYPPSTFVVAEGTKQLIRNAIPADWTAGLKHAERRVVPLHDALRMKSGLARFASAFADHFGIPTGWNIAGAPPGGEVIVVEGPYFRSQKLHERLIAQNYLDQNEPIDMLFCVPPVLAQSSGGSDGMSRIAVQLSEWGYPVWDGASRDVRESFPTNVKQLRIVQYDSCRGLEGWTVVNLGLDEFYSYKLRTYVPTRKELDDAMGDEEFLRKSWAANWLMIPMTRAMDTLVIQVDREDSPVTAALRSARAQGSDFVQWHRLS